MNFKQFLNENSGLNVKNVIYREGGETSSSSGEYSHSFADTKNIAGFIATKSNMAIGYSIYLPSKADIKEFGKESLRLVWSKGTTIVKIDAKKGTLHFLDNEAYEDGKVKFQTPIRYDRLVIDDSANGNKLQEITKII